MLSHIAHGLWFADRINGQVFVDWRSTFFHADRRGGENLFKKYFELLSNWVDLEGENEIVRSSRVLPAGSDLLSIPSFRLSCEPQLLETFALTGRVPDVDIFVSSGVLDFLPQAVLYKYLSALKPNAEILSRVEKIVASIKREGVPIFGVHIRHGNGELYAPGSERERELFDRYAKTIEKVIAKHSQCEFFLVTDSHVARRWFRDNIGKFHFNENVALPEELGAPMHHCGAHVGRLNPIKILEDSIEDMTLLGKFDGLICDTWSSFSRYGKAIGGYKERQALYEVSPSREARNIREEG